MHEWKGPVPHKVFIENFFEEKYNIFDEEYNKTEK